MPWMDQKKKKELAPLIKSICKKHDIKATLGVVHDHRSISGLWDQDVSLVLHLKSGPIDFDHYYINSLCYKDTFADNKKALAFLSEVIPAMNIGNSSLSHFQQFQGVPNIREGINFDTGWDTWVSSGFYVREECRMSA